MERKLSTSRQACQVTFTCLELKFQRIRNAPPPQQVRGTEAATGEWRFRVYFVEKLSGDWPDFDAIATTEMMVSGVFPRFAVVVGLFGVLDRPFPLK
jgi:hypothetical protein